MDGTTAALAYGPASRPPAGTLSLLVLQHAAMVMVFMVYPLVLAGALGLGGLETNRLIVGTLLACALATGVQAARTPWGSGQLGVYIPTPIHLSALLYAVGLGGLPQVAGFALMLCAGELLIARLLPALRVCFPAELCGVVIIGLGMAIAPTALQQFTGSVTPAAAGINPLELGIASLTLATVIACTLFAAGRFRLIAVGLGLTVGSVAGLAADLIPTAGLDELAALPWFGVPSLRLAAPEFSPSLIPAALMLALIISIDNVGVQVGIQRLVDPRWRQIDLRQGRGSVQANAVGDAAAGLLSGMPVGLSSSHVGLIFATNAAARIIAPCTAGLLALAAFMPKGIALLGLIPKPVVGAIMVYTAAYMVVSGMQLTQSRLLSERRRLVVGLSLVAGLLPLVLPSLKEGLPEVLQPLYGSSLTMAAVVAIGLTLLFRLGIRNRARVPGTLALLDFEALEQFFLRLGCVWGARRDLMVRAARVTSEAVEALALLDIPRSAMDCELVFDEDRLRVILDYTGPRLECPPERPAADVALDGKQQLAQLAGHLVRRSVDRLLQTSYPEGQRQRLALSFED
jgi:xanthine/uracil permease